GGTQAASQALAAEVERHSDNVDHGAQCTGEGAGAAGTLESMPTVGVVAIQGDYEKHIQALERCGVSDLIIREVRVPEDLEGVERAIIPGGESTTVGKLMERFGLGAALQERAKEGMPIWGTCMGMILMASEVEGRTGQYSLGLLDATVRRNAF